jgi:hypothetical protein
VDGGLVGQADAALATLNGSHTELLARITHGPNEAGRGL